MPNVILISLHLNAASDGTKWMNATGWSCYTCKGQTQSDNDPDWEENFYILRHSLCPVVLTENFFMDGLDLAFLLSQDGKQSIIDTHIEEIIEYSEISKDKHP